jgi:hypothetical protein
VSGSIAKPDEAAAVKQDIISISSSVARLGQSALLGWDGLALRAALDNIASLLSRMAQGFSEMQTALRQQADHKATRKLGQSAHALAGLIEQYVCGLPQRPKQPMSISALAQAASGDAAMGENFQKVKDWAAQHHVSFMDLLQSDGILREALQPVAHGTRGEQQSVTCKELVALAREAYGAQHSVAQTVQLLACMTTKDKPLLPDKDLHQLV